jgi:hypothetical protein
MVFMRPPYHLSRTARQSHPFAAPKAMTPGYQRSIDFQQLKLPARPGDVRK